jgi:YVTN family beta-propeller protein
VSVISDVTDRAVANIPVGYNPESVAYDSLSGEIFVANDESNNVSVISDVTNRVVATLPAGIGPAGVAYDSRNGDLYVSNSYGGTVSIVSPFGAYAITFTETGLPANTFWSVSLGGVTQRWTGSPILFAEPNGTYPFSVGSVVGLTANRSSGSVTVFGAGASWAVLFTTAGNYSVTFSETGLPFDTSWRVTLNGVGKSSMSGKINFVEFNGTYPYTVVTPPGYAPRPSSGTLIVNGSSTDQPVVFMPTPTYLVTFGETGLISGASWKVTLSGAAESSMTGTISFEEPNGTYGFIVGTVPGHAAVPSSSTLRVNGSSVSTSITYTRVVNYTVTFAESGLPSGTNWTVTLNGTSHTAAASVITFAEPNGSYLFSVGSAAGYGPNPYNSSVSVSGAPISVPITFVSAFPEYQVSFTENGLPRDTNWSVTLGGTTRSSTSTNISFEKVNGTYPYSLGMVAGFTSSSGSGSITLTGHRQTISVAFVGSPKPSVAPGGVPTSDWLVGGAAVAILVGLFLIVLFARRKGDVPHSTVHTPPPSAPATEETPGADPPSYADVWNRTK